MRRSKPRDGAEILSRVLDEGLLERMDAQTCWAMSATCRTLRAIVFAYVSRCSDFVVTHRTPRYAVDDALRNLPTTFFVTRLDLSYTGISDAGIELVSREMHKLEDLNLRHTSVTSIGFSSLTAIVDLKSLNLSNTRIVDADMVALASLTELQNLSINDVAVTGQGVKHLSGMSKLGTLSACRTPIGDEGLGYLPIGTLAALHLEESDITDEGVRALSARTEICILDISHNLRIASGVALSSIGALSNAIILDMSFNYRVDMRCALKTVSNLSKLRSLDVSHNSCIDDASIRQISLLTSLAILNLRAMELQDETLRSVGEMTQLVDLDISGNPYLTTSTIQRMASLRNLKVLDASATSVCDRAGEIFAGMPRLEKIDVSCTAFGSQGLNAFGKTRDVARNIDVLYTDANEVPYVWSFPKGR